MTEEQTQTTPTLTSKATAFVKKTAPRVGLVAISAAAGAVALVVTKKVLEAQDVEVDVLTD